jgi:hypothetical protein
MIILYVLGAILVIVLLLHLLAPTSYHVFRAIEIAKPRAEVFAYLKSLKNQDAWSPWSRKDPNMEKRFTGRDGEVGAISYWKGNKEVGEGEQEITKIVEGERIEGELRFIKPWKSTSDCYFTVLDAGAGNTKITWGFIGKNVFPMTIMTFFMSMDKMVGKDFEKGLQDLKAILEK